jgi:hypothetical protein
LGAFVSVGQQFPLARYRFTFRVFDDLRLPDFSGSLLRGQFGDALRRTACMTGEPRCPPCLLYRTCQYTAIFETPPPAEHQLQRFSAVPNPYVIEPPPIGAHWIRAGELLTFGLVLVGRALEQLPLVVFAFQRALRQGLGELRSKAEIEDVALERSDGSWLSVWDVRAGQITAHSPELPVPPVPGSRIATLRISTPLRLQHHGRPLGPSELKPRALLTAIMRRASLLFEMHAGISGMVTNPTELAQRAEALQDSRELRWHDWKRFSSRQRQEMVLGGVIGEWKLYGDLGPLSQWLWLGQWLHAGKNATMGMGRYDVVFSGGETGRETTNLN